MTLSYIPTSILITDGHCCECRRMVVEFSSTRAIVVRRY